MARDDGMAQAQMLRLALPRALDGVRPSGAFEWVPPVASTVTQAAIGAGHWAAGRRRRALAAWACAAGFGLVTWGLGTESPTQAEADESMERQKDLLRARGIQVPATDRTETFMTRRQVQNVMNALGPSIGVVFGVRSGLRRPKRLTVLTIAGEAPATVLYALRAARAVQRRKPRIAAGSALVAAGSVARLRAVSAEPLP